MQPVAPDQLPGILEEQAKVVPLIVPVVYPVAQVTDEHVPGTVSVAPPTQVYPTWLVQPVQPVRPVQRPEEVQAGVPLKEPVVYPVAQVEVEQVPTDVLVAAPALVQVYPTGAVQPVQGVVKTHTSPSLAHVGDPGAPEYPAEQAAVGHVPAV